MRVVGCINYTNSSSSLSCSFFFRKSKVGVGVGLPINYKHAAAVQKHNQRIMVRTHDQDQGRDRDEEKLLDAAGDYKQLAEPPAPAVAVSLDLLKQQMASFAKQRNWDHFHTPRNLLLAMVGEVGEVSEIFQWKGEVARGLPDWKEEEKLHLGEELSDVLLYLVRLSDICGVDLATAALRKIQLNAIKYPPPPPLDEQGEIN